MKYGVRFCGGCNPRYDRKAAYETIAEDMEDLMDFEIAQEGVEYDGLLVIGGCSNCCAGYSQFDYKDDNVNKMWDKEHIERVENDFKRLNNKL